MRAAAHLWYGLLSSFWFVTGLIAAAFVLLALALVALDFAIDARTEASWPLFGARSAEAARSLLGTIAASIITVAGTVFSITLVALSLASNQYSPRVLRNFVRDRANQLVLGAFLGIFAYCLIVLSVIRGGDTPFVPALATLVGLLLGLVGVGLLVYFIHHIATLVQASYILVEVRNETIETVARLFRHPLGSQPTARACHVHERAQWCPVSAHATGYLQSIDLERLRELACEHDTVVRIVQRVGNFCIEGVTLAMISGDAALASRLEPLLRRCWMIGPQRTLEQDLAYGLRELVDVALRALSPGINDSTTATMCVDNLTAVLARLCDRELRYEQCLVDGVVRVEPCHPEFEELLGRAYDQIREHARGNVAVLDRLLWSIETLAARTEERMRRRGLLLHVERIVETVERTVAASDVRSSLLARAQRLIERLRRARGPLPPGADAR